MLDFHTPDVVVLCHGYASHKDSPFISSLAAGLAAKRMSSFLFDTSIFVTVSG